MSMIVIKVLFSLSILILFVLNLGNLLDVTQKPIVSDIIVCLGGGGTERIQKSVELYDNGYSQYNLLILTGDNRTREEKKEKKEDRRFVFLKDKNIIYKPSTSNTREEILFIKAYMLKNNFTSAIIVSNPSHSRRIRFLLDLYNDKRLIFTIVGVEAQKWKLEEYYKSKKGQVTVIYEWVKLLSSYIAYGILERLGILEEFKQYTSSIYMTIRKQINLMIYRYQKEDK